MRGDLRRRQALEVELQAARQHRHRQLLRVGGGEQEFHVRRRLLERLQQRVERVRREHVHLVDEVHLVAAAGRRVLHVVEQLAGIVDLGARGRIDLDEVDEAAGIDLAAARACAAGLGRDAGLAVEALGEMRAIVVLPTPRVPVKRNAWCTRPVSSAFTSARRTCSWPTSSAKFSRPPFARQRRIVSVNVLGLEMEAARTSSSSGTRHRRCRCCLPALTGFTTGRRGEADAGHHRPQKSFRWRRGWDSNPRTPVKMLLEFQSSAFDRSATSPNQQLTQPP